MIFVWVNKRNWKTPGPIVNVAAHNAASFATVGYETHLCIGAGHDSDTEKDLRDFYGIKVGDKFYVHRVPRWQFRSSTSSLSIFLYANKLIKSLSRKDEVIVFSRESGFLFFLAKLCRNPRIRGYYELHDFYADLSWVRQKKSGYYREKFYEHLFLPRINGLICITSAQQALYRRVFPSIPSCAFPLGTNPVRTVQNIERQRKRRTLMYVGHMHDDKGVDFLLRISAKLSEYGVKTLFWGGKAREIPGLWARSRQLGIADYVEFVDFQPPQVMHRALAERASLGVVMLRDTFYNRYLTCPVKALDYLSHGIPAIASDLPSVREVLGQAGTYVGADDVDDFVKLVERLLNDPEHYRKMASLSLIRAGEISWENRARTIVEFVQRHRRVDQAA